MITTNTLPPALYSAEQVREMDRVAINEHGIDGFELMYKAAQFSFHVLIKKETKLKHIQVLCGSGNNAGDGYLLAAIAHKRNISVEVFYLKDPASLKADAKKAYEYCQATSVPIHPFVKDVLKNTEQSQNVIVDALLGTGLNTDVSGSYADAIHEANEVDTPILAIDIPSGLSANTGQVLGTAIKATWTATYIGLKFGAFTASGKGLSGEIYYDQLEIPVSIIDQFSPIVKKLQLKKLLNTIKPRPEDSHKGNFGHTLIIGGDHGYGGAILMAAEAAARMGTGTITIASHQEHIAASLTRCPEVMFRVVSNQAQLRTLIQTADVIVIGPGLGQSAWSQSMLHCVLSQITEIPIPTIFDADALNLISQHPDWILDGIASRDHYIFTPHPGEAGRLLNQSNATIQQDRLSSIKQLQKKWGGHFLLKGSGSLITHPNTTFHLCPYGNPGMATGGMGDVLSGLIGGLVSQGFGLEHSLQLAVCLHAKAADIAVKTEGTRGLLATDLISVSRQLLNNIHAC